MPEFARFFVRHVQFREMTIKLPKTATGDLWLREADPHSRVKSIFLSLRKFVCFLKAQYFNLLHWVFVVVFVAVLSHKNE